MKRFDMIQRDEGYPTEMVERDDGDFVLHSDHSLAIAAAVQAEREACAKIALNETPGVYDNTDESEGFARACHRIAELIRSRPAPAVDVLGVVREFVDAVRAREAAELTPGEWQKFDALAALVDGAAANNEGGK